MGKVRSTGKKHSTSLDVQHIQGAQALTRNPKSMQIGLLPFDCLKALEQYNSPQDAHHSRGQSLNVRKWYVPFHLYLSPFLYLAEIVRGITLSDHLRSVSKPLPFIPFSSPFPFPLPVSWHKESSSGMYVSLRTRARLFQDLCRSHLENSLRTMLNSEVKEEIPPLSYLS